MSTAAIETGDVRSYIDAHSVEKSDDAKACLQTRDDSDDDLFRGDAPLW